MSMIALGVADLAASRRFYEQGLGWTASASSNDRIVFFQLVGLVLGLYPRTALAEDATVADDGAGFDGITLAYNARDRGEVDSVLVLAKSAGATIAKPAQDVFWGGYSGYFKDPDGHLWEVAWNPSWSLDEDGALRLPD